MALSLVCQDCHAQLRSVAEMQAHTDATSHVNFAESTEPVLNLVCKDCRKPCRSQTEKDLHTKRSGHSDFVDKTIDTPLIDTETEMIEAAQQLKEEAGSSGDSASKDVELVPPAVDTGLRQQLEDMGFSGNKATRALHFTGTSSLDQAITWIMEHEGPEHEEPLLVPKEEPKPKLNAEEARKQAEELIRKTRAKKEKEERELERLREAERIRAGKELLQAKRLEDELRLKRNLEERQHEKEEVARAKEKIRIKLAEDRNARRRKQGLPELTMEEMAAEERAAAEKAKPKVGPVPVKPVTQTDKMRKALVSMKHAAAGDDARAKTAWNTLLKYVGNVAQNPGEEKFRKIKLSNAAFQSRVASLNGSIDFLKALGFEPDAANEVLELPQANMSMEVLNIAGGEINNALTNPFFGVL